MASPPKSSLIVLTGFMGSGKSTVGRALASLIGWHFVDLDDEIERADGRKIREIFSQEGEVRFREIETAVLSSQLGRMPRPTVMASGGGIFAQAHNAELLRAAGTTLVFLEASAETLVQRCCSEDSDQPRPLARDREEFVRLYEQRLPWYRKADLTVVTDNKEPELVAHEIADLLRLEG